ncbi:primosomal protein N' family DNA-binding protein [Anaerococcus lactolyticus]|nr:hypothetical protein [Anaerococcus lactolyticus]
MYAEVIIDSKSRFLNRSFTYRIPEKLNNKLQRAMRVLVPFGKGNKTVVAFVYQIVEEFNCDYEIKDIISIIDDSKLVSDELLDLAFFMSKEYLSPIQLSLKQVLPPTTIDKIKTFYKAKVKGDDFLNFLQVERSREDIIRYYPDSLDLLNDLIKNDKVKIFYEARDKIKISFDTYIKLKDFNATISNNAIKQKKIIEYLKVNGLTKQSDLLKNTSSSLSSLKSLIKKNIIEEVQKEANKEIKLDVKNYDKHQLNKEQALAYQKILAKPDG